jgi:GntR family transcriptional regulator, gluconate operon transcriptional repressor
VRSGRPPKPRVTVPIPPSEHGRQQLWEEVADSLRRAILAGTLPAGTGLVEADLAAQFDVSRGPIRDALRELVREGILADIPRRGTVVATLTTADIREVYAVREGLETVASRLAVTRAGLDDLTGVSVHVDRLEDAWDRKADYADSLAEDLAFHRAVVALAGNERLSAIYEQMLGQTQLLARTAAASNPSLTMRMKRSAHREIQDALLARDAELAATAIADHYAYAVERLFEATNPDTPVLG